MFNLRPTTSIWASSEGGVALDYLNLQQTKTAIPAGTGTQVTSPAYLWPAQPGTLKLDRYLEDSGGIPFFGETQSFSTNYCPPIARVVGVDGAVVDVDLENGVSVSVETEIAAFLNALLYSKTHDAAWPEDSYAGGEKAAYDWFKTTLGGAPKEGTVVPGLINAQHYPSGQGFTEADFDTVQTHLATEASYFVYAQQWFGSNGVLTALNTQSVIAAQGALTSVSELVQVKQSDQVELILDTVFKDIIAVVGIIPVVGGAISAVLSISLNSVEEGLSKTSPSINAAVSELAQQIVETLQSLTDATAGQLTTIGGNWGKLETFAKAVIAKKISTEQLGVEMPDPDGPPKTPVTPGQDFIEATEKAWELSFYKVLYPIRFTPTVWDQDFQLHSSSTYTQGWEPENGQYTFYFALPAVKSWTDGNNYSGFLVFTCKPNAPSPVMDRLFRADQLGVNPISFFLGLDGWASGNPRYLSPKNRFEPIPTVISVG